jgi:Uma2 family endonuclease
MSAVLTPPPDPVRPVRFSRAEYYRLAALGFFDGKRVERVRGEVVEMSPTDWAHAVACRKTGEALDRAFTGIAWVSRGDQPIALADSDPEPDVMAVAGRFEDHTDHPTTALLVVDVADTTLARDLTTKAVLYAEAGIPEYWVLDLVNRRLHVFRDPGPLPAGPGSAYGSRVEYGPADSVCPLAAPAAAVGVADLLP